MLTEQKKQQIYAGMFFDAALLCLAFAVAFLVRYYTPDLWQSSAKPHLSEHIWMLLVCIPAFWFIASLRGMYNSPGAKSILRHIRISIITFALVGPFLGTVIFLFQANTFSRGIFFIFLWLALLLVGARNLLFRWIAQRSSRFGDGQRNVLVVGVGKSALSVCYRLRDHAYEGLKLTGCLLSFGESHPGFWEFPILGGIEDLKKIVEDEVIDEVIFTVPIEDMSKCEQYISWCEEVGVAVHMKLDFIKTVVARTYPTNWDGLPMLTISATPQDPLRLLIKRSIDIAIAAFALIVLSPVLVVSSLLVKLTSKGPLIFKQRRVGLNGRQFMLYKFRSMYSDAEERKKELEALNEASGPVFKIRRDPRITPVGSIMRKYSIDELPQLWNVLRGDMSLVGPRPPVPEEVTKYERWQRRRLSMKPGITCLWQVSGRSQIGFDEWMQLDLEYIDKWSLKLDAVILLRTMPAVIFARGAH